LNRDVVTSQWKIRKYLLLMANILQRLKHIQKKENNSHGRLRPRSGVESGSAMKNLLVRAPSRQVLFYFWALASHKSPISMSRGKTATRERNWELKGAPKHTITRSYKT
jgi:hypothetical protein